MLLYAAILSRNLLDRPKTLDRCTFSLLHIVGSRVVLICRCKMLNSDAYEIGMLICFYRVSMWYVTGDFTS